MTEQLSKHACRKTGLSVLTPDSPRNPHSGAHCPWLAGMATFLPLQMHCCVPLVPEWVLFCCLLRVPFILLGLPGGSVSEESHCSTGDPGSITGSGRSPEKEMATHSSTLAWKIPWTEEPGRLPSMRSQRVEHD